MLCRTAAVQRFSFLIFALALMLSANLYGQAISGNIVGTVMDQTNAVVPRAQITAENTQTGVKTAIMANEKGEFVLNDLPVGTYSLTVNATGFGTTNLQDLKVALNQTITANVILQLGVASTTVDVVVSGVTIDTTTAQIQSTYTKTQIADLPTNGQPGTNFGALNLSLLSSGVTSSGGVGVGIGPSVGGQRPRNNNFTVEGTDNNRKDVTGPVVYVPIESTSEFTLLQNFFAPEYGHSSGGQFNLIIKSGTNDYHGQIYEYFQNRNLNAVDQLLANQGTYSNPRFDQNRLGGVFGGRFIKDKLFFFGSYEYNPLGLASVPPGVFGPTAAGFAALSAIPGLYQTNLNILKQYLPVAPTATSSTVICPGVPSSSCAVDKSGAAPAGSYTIPIGPLPLASPNFTNSNTWIYSMDYNIRDADQLRGRFVSNRITAIDNTPNLPAFYSLRPTHQYLFTLAEYHNFSPTVNNEFRFGYTRYNDTIAVPTPPYPGLDTFPNIQIDNDLGIQIGPDPNGPQYTIINTYELVDNVNWNKGNHNFKFGFDGRRLIAPQQFTQRARGDYDYSTLNQYLNDFSPDDLSERSIGSTPYYGNQWAFYFYANDNWRIRRNLTINLGLRYEYTTVPYGETLQSLNHIADVPGVIVFNSPTAQKNNWAPRIGLAYSPGTSGNTSIRAGFGMAYDVLYDNIGTLSQPPQFSTTIDTDLTGNTPRFLQNGGILPIFSPPTTPTEARALTANYIPNQILPYGLNWTFGVQHVFKKDYTFEARYLGSRGVHLPTQTRLNAFPAVTPTHQLPTYLVAPSQAQLNALPLTLDQLEATPTNPLDAYGFPNNITSFPSNGYSSYNGLALQGQRRFTAGLQFQASYTWSHLIDNSTADFFSTYLTPRRPQDFLNLTVDKASSALDHRHRFTFSGIWDLPMYKESTNWYKKNLLGNWLWTGTYTYESPEYATVQSGQDSNLNGDTAGDRAIVNPLGVNGRGTDVTPLTNSGGQIVAYLANDPTARYIRTGLGSYGNAGRNTLPTNPINNFDMALLKKFTIHESMTLRFGAQAFNVFNHPQFTPGQLNNINITSQITTRNFLIPGTRNFNDFTSIFSSNPRTLQLVGQFIF
jgi:Carboxypeptidase regulatory-like domain